MIGITFHENSRILNPASKLSIQNLHRNVDSLTHDQIILSNTPISLNFVFSFPKRPRANQIEPCHNSVFWRQQPPNHHLLRDENSECVTSQNK